MGKKMVLRGILFFLLIFLSMVVVYQVVGSVTIGSGDSQLTITITDAFYTDLEQSGVENDVVSHFTLELTNEEEIQRFFLYITLRLPSGTEYSYWYYISTNQSLEATMNFYNHATESGWYDLKILGILLDRPISCGLESYTFDPPGSGGGDPAGVTLVLNPTNPSDSDT